MMCVIRNATLILLVSLYGFTRHQETPVRWVLSKDCSLKVNGSTNVNKFSCVISSYPKADTLTIFKHSSIEPLKIVGDMVLNVNAFNCHNPIMTKDLRKTLKADKYPELIVSFISISKYPLPSTKETSLKGWVAIALAGVTRKFEIEYRCIPGNTNTLTMIGNKTLNFSDFNIVPPRKLGGMIQTNDALTVEFILKMNLKN